MSKLSNFSIVDEDDHEWSMDELAAYLTKQEALVYATRRMLRALDGYADGQLWMHPNAGRQRRLEILMIGWERALEKYRAQVERLIG
jgi:hypothetical protein